MSTREEIMEVYEGDIERMTTMVVNRRGPMVLYEGMENVEDIWPDGFVEMCAGTEAADFDAALDEINAPAHKRADKGSL